MEKWRQAWREGIAPCLLDEELQALRDALATNDPALIQGCTAHSDPRTGCLEGGCAIGLAAWRGRGLRTMAEADRAFTATFDAAEVRLASTVLDLSPQEFVDWFDLQPMEEVRPALLAEVERALAGRRKPA